MYSSVRYHWFVIILALVAYECPVVTGTNCTTLCYNPFYSGYLCCEPIVSTNDPVYCPYIDSCSAIRKIVMDKCDTDDDCLRKEKCCNDPCDDGVKKCMLADLKLKNISINCPTISNCREWGVLNPTPEYCQANDNCKRRYYCCTNPCVDRPTCLPEAILI